MTPAGRLVVLAAPSGAGKTTIAQTLMTRRPDVGFSISVTTRAPRPGERDGSDYHFVTRAQFDGRIKAGEFLEWAEFAGNRYGTLRSEVDRIRQAGRHVLLDIEVQGAAQVRKAYPWPQSVAIFLLPPNAAELMRRLEGRGTETPMALWRRLDQARHELMEAGKFDVIVVNDDLEQAVTDVGRAIDSQAPPAMPPAMQDRVNALIRDLTKGTN